MSGFSTVFTLLLTALVLENAVFSRALDATTLLAVPFGRKGAWLFGGILTGVTTFSAALACLLSGLIGKLPAIAYLRPVAYLLLMILLYALTCLALFWKQKSWLDSNFSMLNLAFFNTAVYGAMSLAVYSGLNGWQGAIYGFGVGVSYLLAVVILAVLLATVVLMILLRWNFFQWLGWVLAAVCVVFFLHTGFYGLNQYAGSIADDVRLEMTEYSVAELADATEYYRDKAAQLAEQVERDLNDDPVYPAFHDLAVNAGEGFDVMTYQRSASVFAGSTLPVKELGWADMYTSMGITGFTFPLTGEAAVNPQIPAVSLPFTMCHEMAHRMCIATERDANFAAFLACRFNSSVEYQYSAYFMAYKYCYNALVAVGGTEATDMAAKIKAGEGELLRHDLVSYSQFFNSRKNDQATQLASKVNDTYIKTSGDEAGTLSYGQVSDYLVNWYIQEIVAPNEVVEEKFDPFDEDVVFATVPPTEETQGEEE